MTVEMPKRIAALPRDSVGRPVPWFVAWIDGKPDFRIGDADKLRPSIEGRCWVCGQPRSGPTAAFVVGPMCAVNRVSSEPPSHRDCAVFSARTCPFLVNPHKVRRDANVPDAAGSPAGVMIERNPGVALVWISRKWSYFRAPAGADGVLFDLGKLVRAEWYCQGRPATRTEVEASIDSGLPLLEQACDNDREREVLARQVGQARDLLPD